MLLLARRLPDPAGALRRLTPVTRWCAVVAVLAAVDLGWLRISSEAGLAGPFGLISLSALVLGVLAGLVALARSQPGGGVGGRRTGGHPLAGAAGQLVLLAVAAGTALALGRLTPPRPEATAETTVQNVRTLVGFSPPPPLSVATLLTRWYPDWLFITVAVALAAVYLARARRAAAGDRPAGRGWPAGRTAPWLAGCVVGVWATNA